MIVVSNVKRFAEAKSNPHDAQQIPKRDGQDDDGAENGDDAGMSLSIEVGKDSQNGEKVADEVAAGIAKKGAGAWEVVGQEPGERATGEERDEGDEVLSGHAGDQGKAEGSDGAEAGAKAVHIIHEIEGVYVRQDPEQGDGVAKREIVNEQSDPSAGGGDEECDGALPGKLHCRAEFIKIIQQAQHEHTDSSGKNGGELDAATIQAVQKQGLRAGGGVVDSWVGWDRPEVDQKSGDESREEKARDNAQTAGKRNGFVMDLAMAGIVDKPDAQAPTFP